MNIFQKMKLLNETVFELFKFPPFLPCKIYSCIISLLYLFTYTEKDKCLSFFISIF